MRHSYAVRALMALVLLVIAASLGYASALAGLVVTGRVTSEGGAPLEQAQVYVPEMALSVATDAEGVFRLLLPDRLRDSVIVVRARAIGYAPLARTLHLVKDTTVADFELRRDVNRLSEVTVSGTQEATDGARVPFSVGGVRLRAATAHHPDPQRDLSGESYGRIVDNGFRSPRVIPLSTFSVDVDRASYSNVRRLITVDRQRPPVDAVRIEEMINYFPYEYAPPTGEHPFAVRTDVAAAPWAPEHLLVRIALQARTLDLDHAPANNLVFLIDVSGSMRTRDKLPLLKTAFRMLVKQLREEDHVAIVTYAGREGLALPSTSGAQKEAILAVIDQLESGGSTAGGAGLRLAYDIAKQNFIHEGNNRVILATDGDFNVGVTNNGELEKFIALRREEGTALTVLGFGAENIKDDRMEMLADKGNGNYAYIDSPLEARKVLVNEMGGTLVTVAKDVKLQVEFNPAVVAGYRLIGYENRLLADEDFKDDAKDAGEMGAGHSVTALYEIVPMSASDARRVKGPDPLRYARQATARRADTSELMYVKLRYKAGESPASIPMDLVVPNRVTDDVSTDFRFAQAVAAFGMVLRNSDHRGRATPGMALELAEGALGRDPFGYRSDFLKLVTTYMELPELRTAAGRRQ
jgi:Ca-activated chloride channel family protein